MLFSLLTILTLIICLLLVAVILIQNPKGGGLSGSFGGGGTQSFGVQETNDFLNKSTWALVGVILALILVTNVVLSKSKDGIIQTESIEKVTPSIETDKPLEIVPAEKLLDSINK